MKNKNSALKERMEDFDFELISSPREERKNLDADKETPAKFTNLNERV